jgi:diadenylate cyclase
MTWLNDLLQRPPVTFWDVVDIILVSIVVYEVLKLIRGTHAVQMGIGIALHIGRAPLFRVFRQLDRQITDDDTVEELVGAAAALAGRRTGALIIIERSIGLRNYIESGIPLDAQLTYDLLVSIFQPTSPLHDGAVIVQNDRVAAAACFLPLTVNPRLGRELGSRHRAAIGVTEENDAVAIVVSEETGVISLVLDGAIERELDPEQLRIRLAQLVLRRRGLDRPGKAGYSLS